MRGGGDPDNRRDFPGGFPGDPANAFERRGRTPEQAAVFDHARRLLHLRRDLEPLRRGDLEILHASRDAWALVRRTSNALALVVIHNGNQPFELELPASRLGISAERTFAPRYASEGVTAASDGDFRLRLPARSFAIYSD
jgi:glycosidase